MKNCTCCLYAAPQAVDVTDRPVTAGVTNVAADLLSRDGASPQFRAQFPDADLLRTTGVDPLGVAAAAGGGRGAGSGTAPNARLAISDGTRRSYQTT